MARRTTPEPSIGNTQGMPPASVRGLRTAAWKRPANNPQAKAQLKLLMEDDLYEWYGIEYEEVSP